MHWRDRLWAMNPVSRVWGRLLLSRAKHRSLAGHPGIALRLSRWLPHYRFDPRRFFDADDAPAAWVERRRRGFERLAARLETAAPRTIAATRALAGSVSDVDFVNRYRVPFPFRDLVAHRMPVGQVVSAAEGVRVRDLDGNWSYELSGSYGVNLFGVDFYRRCIEEAVDRADDVGLVLGPYHPLVADNVARLKRISGLDEVSFHMSGTEAVMQAVRLARYHTGRPRVVRFAGAYHGWWDGVQVGPGNPLPARDVFTLEERSEHTLRVLRQRRDVACVLVNPLQALAPNASPASDSALVAGTRSASYDKAAHAAWLRELRAVCTARGIALVFDEVALGFRLARGGVQEYFGVRADLVTYGKTLGGGLPVGALCGGRRWMRRFRDDRPADVCFARGTFNSHPYVMAAMHAFLRFLDTPEAEETWHDIDARWDGRAARLNARLEAAGVPVRVRNMTSYFVTTFTQPGRYHWMLQYYLRAAELSLGWIGSARIIFSHDYTNAHFDAVAQRIVEAAVTMQDDGWFWAEGPLAERRLRRRLRGEIVRAALGLAERPSRRPSRGATPAPADLILPAE